MNGKPQAHGLAFSYKKVHELDTHIPYSLMNIFKELEDDLHDGFQFPPPDTDLTRWAKQGVLLLNTAWTVKKDDPGSHCKLWEGITAELLLRLSALNTGIIYVLWGKNAQSFSKYITITNYVLKAAHPASERYGTKGFFGCKHFSKINEIIKNNNGDDYIIQW